MSLTDIFRSAAFRLGAAFSLAFTLVTLLLFIFIYWQTAVAETQRIDGLLVEEAATVAREPEADLMRAVRHRLENDLHHVAFAAVFSPDGQVIAGNLQAMPPTLAADGQAYRTDAVLAGTPQAALERARAVARRLPDGRVLVIGRTVEELILLRQVVLRGLALGLIPAVLLSFGVSVFASLKTLQRVKVIHQATRRIMHGDLEKRLPSRGGHDDLDQMVQAVNEMLDEIAHLVTQVRGVGDDIAHDLRTPLTRLRARLERCRVQDAPAADVQRVIDRSIADLDQTLTIITALLRIGEIEGARQRSAFAPVSLDALIHEVGELYGPIAEARGLTLDMAGDPRCSMAGDRDLLTEALANLVDNAIKFTPEFGAIRLSAFLNPGGQPVIRVADTGPGVPLEEREAVLKRFYRSDKSRHVEGSGLGLSLVAAIARLHGLSVVIADGQPGCVVELTPA